MQDPEIRTQNEGIVPLADQQDDSDFEDRLLHQDEGSKGSSSRDPGAGKPMGGVSDAEARGHAPIDAAMSVNGEIL